MKKSEINFCEIWRAVAVGGTMDARALHVYLNGRPDLNHYQPPAHVHSSHSYHEDHRDEGYGPQGYYSLTGIGADLVASYEAAVSLGLEILPDDVAVAYEPPRDWPKPPEPCPDCEFGRVSIPGLMSIVPVDPDDEVTQTMRCPTCKGASAVEVDVAKRAFASLGPVVSTRTGVHASAGDSNRWSDLRHAGVIDGWRQLTRAEGERLTGKPFEARRNVEDPPRRHVASTAQPDAFAGFLRLVGGGNMRFDGTWWVRVPEPDGWQPLTPELAETLTGKRIEAKAVVGDPHQCTARGISPCGKWLRVDFTEGRRDRAGVLGNGYPLRGGWSVRVVDDVCMSNLDAFEKYVGASPILTAARQSKTGGRHDA